MPGEIIDFEQARDKAVAKVVRGLVAEDIRDAVAWLEAIEAELRSGRAVTEKEAHDWVEVLAEVMGAGLYGAQIRAWATSLLRRLGEVAAGAMSAEDGQRVEGARAALLAFDAVAFGTISPAAIRAHVLEGELARPRPAER